MEDLKELVPDDKKSAVNLQMVKTFLKILPFIHSLRNTEIEPDVFSVIDKDLNLAAIKQSLKKEAAVYGYICLLSGACISLNDEY